MASTKTLAQIRTAAKYKADMENTSFVSDAEWLVYINESAKWFYDLLVDADVEYYLTSTTIAADGTNDTYALAADFYKLLGVDYDISGETATMEKYTFGERNRYTERSRRIRYRLQGSNIKFIPVPAAQTITYWYVPTYTELSADGDTLDTINGWHEFVVLDAAMKALIKEESDVSALSRERDLHVARIESMKENRDIGMPEKVTDVHRLDAHPSNFLGDF